MAGDSSLFRTLSQLETDGWRLEGNVFLNNSEKYLPLYEGKMISHFDHRFGTYASPIQSIADNGKLPELNEQQHANPNMLPVPQYWLHQSSLSFLLNNGQKALVAYRKIARSGDARTAFFSILPVVPCGDSICIVMFNTKRSREMMYFTSCTSSIVFDYVVRQKLGGTNLAFFIVKQLPVVPPSEYEAYCKWDKKIFLGDWFWPRTLELTYTAWDLESFAKDCGYDGSPFRWDEERRFLLRCELDAAYFHLYGIERDDVDYIMETFPIVKRKDEQQFGEYRMKRVILEIYDELHRAMETGERYQTRLEPPSADQTVAHEPRKSANLQV